MGMVLSFSPRSGATGRSKASGEAAAVIIFPGVRYERVPDEDAAPQPKTAEAPKSH